MVVAKADDQHHKQLAEEEEVAVEPVDDPEGRAAHARHVHDLAHVLRLLAHEQHHMQRQEEREDKGDDPVVDGRLKGDGEGAALRREAHVLERHALEASKSHADGRVHAVGERADGWLLEGGVSRLSQLRVAAGVGAVVEHRVLELEVLQREDGVVRRHLVRALKGQVKAAPLSVSVLRLVVDVGAVRLIPRAVEERVELGETAGAHAVALGVGEGARDVGRREALVSLRHLLPEAEVAEHARLS
mmetsp:Transcript_36280/g.85629  ORF Transcript_36280/g.85629 Transcript_36280/m.85629 type:complete len:245 (-) Transcript_36280:4777-5511(-)